MMFGSVKFLLPINRGGDFLLIPLCLLRAVARNFNLGPIHGFFLCVPHVPARAVFFSCFTTQKVLPPLGEC